MYSYPKIFQPSYIAILRITTAIILFAHSIPSIFSGDVNQFGRLYLNEIGFAPYGVIIAWSVKLSHVVAAICLVLNKWIVYPCLLTIAVLVTGIFLVHLKDGWFVVGGGRNGIEYNVLLIAVIISILLYNHRINNQLHKKISS